MTGNELRKIRSDMGLSQQRFADVLGKSIATIKDWESGRTKIDDLLVPGIRLRTGALEVQHCQQAG